MIDDVRPKSFICGCSRILDAHRTIVVEALAMRRDEESMPVEAMPTVRSRARRAAAYWRNNHGAAIEIETRLARGRLNQIDIDAKVFVRARELFAMFDQLMQSAQSRRVGLMCEISVRREFEPGTPGQKGGG